MEIILGVIAIIFFISSLFLSVVAFKFYTKVVETKTELKSFERVQEAFEQHKSFTEEHIKALKERASDLEEEYLKKLSRARQRQAIAEEVAYNAVDVILTGDDWFRGECTFLRNKLIEVIGNQSDKSYVELQESIRQIANMMNAWGEMAQGFRDELSPVSRERQIEESESESEEGE